MERVLVFYKDYFFDFFDKQTENVKKKIDWTLLLVKELPIIPDKFFKHIAVTEGLYEICVKVGTNIYRIFSFFDKGNLVIIANGFQKKTEKTPLNEIERALRIKKEYEDENNEFRSSGFVIRSFFSRRTGFYRIAATKLIQYFFFCQLSIFHC